MMQEISDRYCHFRLSSSVVIFHTLNIDLRWSVQRGYAFLTRLDGGWLLYCDHVFFFQAEDGIRDLTVTGVQTCALPILPHRNQVEKIHQRAHVRDCSPYPYARGTIHRVGRERSAQPPERTGEPDARVFARVRRILLEPDHGAEPGDEHWRCGLDAVALQRLHVTHFVDIDGKNQAERALPAPDRPVQARRKEHAEERPALGETQQQQLRLREDEQQHEFELREIGRASCR